MTWHQWHQTAEMDSRIGRPASLVSSKALADQGCQLISAARLGRGEKWKSPGITGAPTNSRRSLRVRGDFRQPHDKVTRVKQWHRDLDQRGRRAHRKELA